MVTSGFKSFGHLSFMNQFSKSNICWPQQPPREKVIKLVEKPFFLLVLAPFLQEAVEATQCYFFENWFIKLKCPTLLKPLVTVIQQNYWSFYPSEPFTFTRYTMRHPVYEIHCYLSPPKSWHNNSFLSSVYYEVYKNIPWKRNFVKTRLQNCAYCNSPLCLHI